MAHKQAKSKKPAEKVITVHLVGLEARGKLLQEKHGVAYEKGYAAAVVESTVQTWFPRYDVQISKDGDCLLLSLLPKGLLV